MARAAKPAGKQRQLRIIGGAWRGRKFSFPELDGLRPTGDRIRETLFNWLAPHLQGARCVDLFAGSGALGLEALSRGALHCDFVDTSDVALSQIANHLEVVAATDRSARHRQAADAFLLSKPGPYDIVFVDPPFSQSLVTPACQTLADQELLAPNSLVYIETPANEARPSVPTEWVLLKDKVTGAVAYQLYRCNNPPSAK